MNKTLRNLAAAVLLASGAQAGASGGIAWSDSFAGAKSTATRTGKLMLVDFWREH